ncbi:hypothetical protein HMPREF1051_0902 [Neisseria sicca VK64]|uniref:Uncharacterized protein n=1 Tax=Neisseria sicca VK64 TaxID=1095748 RepID=I2NTG2_NEISI|nr:hypothetical protein HMPREF1051_0902 [Neisseria sicca VK64]
MIAFLCWGWDDEAGEFVSFGGLRSSEKPYAFMFRQAKSIR